MNSLVLWGLYGLAGREDHWGGTQKQLAQDVWSLTYSDASYHWEEPAPFGRSLLRGHAYSQGWLYLLPSSHHLREKYHVH